MTRDEMKAPKGMFRVVGVDTFSNEDWVYGDYKTFKEAKEFADKHGGNMNVVYVYDDKGSPLHHAGTY